MMKMTAIVLFLFSNLAYAAHPYYGERGSQIENKTLHGKELREELHRILKDTHTPKAGNSDEIDSRCNGRRCYRHTPLGYNKARRSLMGDIHLLVRGSDYFVEDVYCQKWMGPNDFRSRRPGPDRIPDNNIVNTEHTWPQSRFSRRFPKAFQKSDLHALYPTLSKANSARSSHEFGEVTQQIKVLCGKSKVGRIAQSGGTYFEPPDAHKGNVARALFYFAVRYNMKISPIQESFLRRWHQQDPVDAAETMRNEKIADLQMTRNPFIDYPHLVDQIKNF